MLITKWVDDGDPGPGAGDRIITNQYPEDFAASTFGTFGVNEHTVTGVGASNGASECVANLPTGPFGEEQFVSFTADTVDERYGEWGDYPQLASFTSFVDSFDGSGPLDVIAVTPASPSLPPDPLNPAGPVGGTDDAFLDVELNCSTG